MASFLIGFGFCWIVSLTFRPTSWAQPEFLIVTEKARLLVVWIVFRVVVESSLPEGSTFVETMPVPRGLQVEPPVAAPWTRCQKAFIEALLAMSGFGKKTESGTLTPVMFSFASSSLVG